MQASMSRCSLCGSPSCRELTAIGTVKKPVGRTELASQTSNLLAVATANWTVEQLAHMPAVETMHHEVFLHLTRQEFTLLFRRTPATVWHP